MRLQICAIFASMFISLLSYAAPDESQLSVWVNEAIVATYTYNHTNFLQRQQQIAKYFTAQSWINYSTALQASKLPDSVQKNAYYVSAVALMPPTIKTLGLQSWQASMPLLVVYKNPQYQQKQTLEVVIHFQAAPKNQGIRGLTITSLQAQITVPPCRCSPPGLRAAIV